MSSMDEKVRKSKEQQHSEGVGEKRKSGYSGGRSGNGSQIDRINEQLAKPNLTDSARKALQQKKKQLGG